MGNKVYFVYHHFFFFFFFFALSSLSFRSLKVLENFFIIIFNFFLIVKI